MKNQYVLRLLVVSLLASAYYGEAKGMGPDSDDELQNLHESHHKSPPSQVEKMQSKDETGLEDLGPIVSLPKDLYGLFGLDSSATDLEIGQAFRKLSLEFHPDKQGSSYKGSREYEKFLELVNASRTLKNPETRETYDKQGTVEGYDVKHSPLRPTQPKGSYSVHKKEDVSKTEVKSGKQEFEGTSCIII